MFIFAVAYLSFPVFIILFSFFSTPFVVLSTAALVVLIFCLYRTYQSNSNWQIKSLVKYWPLLLVSLLAAYFSVVVGFDAPDWKNYFAISNALTNNTWPPVLEVDGQTWFLRYYLSWFVPSSLLAKIFGLQVITPAMFVWQAVGIFIALLLMFQNLHKAKHLLLATLVFFLFSGLDIVGALLINSHHIKYVTPAWIITWAGTNLFVILSNLTVLQHSPHHAVVAYLTAALFFVNRKSALQYGAVLLVITAMWSPFCAIGLLPIVVVSLYKEGWRIAFSPQNLLAAPLLAVPIVLYLLQGAQQIPHMFVWQHTNFYFPFFILFCVLEFLLILTIFYHRIEQERVLVATIAIFLTLLCTYNIGLYADLLVRAAMPAVVIMSILMFKAMLLSKGWRLDILIAYMIIGAIPAVVAFTNGASTPISQVHRNATFEQYLDERAAKDRDVHRSQNLVDVNLARYIGSVPLLRGLPEIK